MPLVTASREQNAKRRLAERTDSPELRTGIHSINGKFDREVGRENGLGGGRFEGGDVGPGPGWGCH